MESISYMCKNVTYVHVHSLFLHFHLLRLVCRSFWEPEIRTRNGSQFIWSLLCGSFFLLGSFLCDTCFSAVICCDCGSVCLCIVVVLPCFGFLVLWMLCSDYFFAFSEFFIGTVEANARHCLQSCTTCVRPCLLSRCSGNVKFHLEVLSFFSLVLWFF